MTGTLALLAQKGGAGKTTVALSLAVAHERAGGTAAVVDLDPQGSAGIWSALRGSAPPLVIPAQPPRLARVIAAAQAGGATLVIIDTAPRAASGALEAARRSNLVLVPCRPSPLDLAAIPATVNIARLAGTPAVVLLSCVPARGNWASQAAEAARGIATVCPVALGQRVAHVRAVAAGMTAQETEPRSLAAAETEALYRWTTEAK